MRTTILTVLLFLAAFSSYSQEVEYLLKMIHGEKLLDPQDLIIDERGHMYVADNITTREFDTSGNFLREYSSRLISSDPALSREIKSNMSIAKDAQGNAFLLGKNNLIQKLDPAGNAVLTFGEMQTFDQYTVYTSGIAVDQQGFIYVSNILSNTITKYDSKGKQVKVIGAKGAGAGQFNLPSQLTINASGNLLVADSRNGRVQILSSSGDYIRSIGKSENNGAPMFPTDIALDKNGNMYVTDTISYKVLRFDANGKLTGEFGAKGPDNGKFTTNNLRVAVDADGNVYVAEGVTFSWKSKIQKFDNQGKYVATILDNRNSADYRYAASDPLGNFITANPGTGFIQKFNAKGELLLSFNSRSDTPNDYIGGIYDVDFDNRGNIYVLGKSKNGSVKMYNPSGHLVKRFAPSYEYDRDVPYNHRVPYTPYKLAFDNAGNMYIGDIRKIFKYNAFGELVKKIKMYDPVKGDSIYFDISTSFDVSNKQEIFVISKDGIQKYDNDGKYLGGFVPSDLHTYNGPAKEIDFDLEGNIYLMDQGYIRRYNQEGTLISKSNYHPTLINQGIHSELSVSKNGSRIIVSAYGRVSTYESVNRTESYTASKNYITGNIYSEADADCIKSSSAQGIEGIVVEAKPGPYYGVSDKAGNYFIEVDSGSYSISQVLPATAGREITEICAPTKQITFAVTGATSTGNNFANKVILSPYLTTSVSSTRRRRCFESTTKVTYSNTGFVAANNAKLYLQLPEEVTLLSADKAYTRLPDGTYVFDAGTVTAGETKTITIQDIVTCGNESVRGLTVCTKAWISTGKLPENPVATVTGECDPETGKVRFVIRNNGPQDMEAGKLFRIYRDDKLSTVEQYKLATGDSLVLWVTALGRTIRLEAEQPDGNGENTLASKTVEGCQVGGSDVPVSMGIVNMFPPDDEESEVAAECLIITDSYDPNDKLVTPTGLTQENYTPTGVALKYKIRFQNTGTDVAYRVVVVDTLSENLDISTLQMGSASHNYRFDVTGKGKPVLTWTFDNIMLPDSNRNELGSHGYIQFSIKPKADLPEKTLVENFADIFFDFNSPVRTNITANRIYDMPEVISEADRLHADDIIATPGITGFTPESGKAGTEVIVTGKKFSTDPALNKLYFNGVAATIVSASETELKVIVPGNATSGNLKVQTRDGAAQSTNGFEVYQSPAINSFSPIEGIVGTTVTLQGKHLNPEWLQTIKLGGLECEIISKDGNTVVVKVPEGATTATFEAISKGGEAQTTTAFVVWHQPAIDALSKTTDKAGATIEIIGANFAPAPERNKVMFGKVQAQVLQATTTVLMIKVPKDAENGPVTIETPGGLATSPVHFTLIPAPEVLTFTPAIGTVGSDVTLTGINFLTLGEQDTISFNGQKALVLEATPTLLKVRVPRGASTGKIKVAGIGGYAVTMQDFRIEELSLEQAIEVYPNPTTGNFTIRFMHADFEIQQVQLFSTVGQLIYSEKVANPRPDRLDVKLSIPKAGIYILHIKTERGLVAKKLHVL